MSGHSKWSTIKRQKGANDAKRGALFTKVAREIMVSARAGGGDPDANYRLRLAIDKARAVNMPMDNIKRAIERATGAAEGEQFEEIVYEGYGPGGVAILVEAMTDNRNRTASDVRSMFTKAGGQLAGSGAVAWQFEPRGLISVPTNGRDADELALTAIDAGAADVDEAKRPAGPVDDSPAHGCSPWVDAQDDHPATSAKISSGISKLAVTRWTSSRSSRSSMSRRFWRARWASSSTCDLAIIVCSALSTVTCSASSALRTRSRSPGSV